MATARMQATRRREASNLVPSFRGKQYIGKRVARHAIDIAPGMLNVHVKMKSIVY